jgi:protein involved in polysaccharide export with SLBB domain
MQPAPKIALVFLASASLALGACASPRQDPPGRGGPPPGPGSAKAGTDFTDIGYASWSDFEPPYRFYPGDEIEVTLPTAPELNKTVTVQPDGRIALPLIGPIMAADRTVGELQASLGEAYSGQLLRPAVDVAVKAAPLKVFVGGEVGTPGIYDMAGDGDALRAIIQAGDFKPSADRSKVVIIRRGPDGRGMMRRADLQRGLKGPGADLIPLRRFDIVYVPRSGVASAGLFVQQYFRDLSPIQFGFSYALGNQTVQ